MTYPLRLVIWLYILDYTMEAIIQRCTTVIPVHSIGNGWHTELGYEILPLLPHIRGTREVVPSSIQIRGTKYYPLLPYALGTRKVVPDLLFGTRGTENPSGKDSSQTHKIRTCPYSISSIPGKLRHHRLHRYKERN